MAPTQDPRVVVLTVHGDRQVVLAPSPDVQQVRHGTDRKRTRAVGMVRMRHLFQGNLIVHQVLRVMETNIENGHLVELIRPRVAKEQG